MIYSAEAAAQVDDLRRHYRAISRIEALRNLAVTLTEAEAQIEQNTAAGLPAPRPYPELIRPGLAWMKAGRYWIAYSTARPPVILGVFYETADIPSRI